MSTHNPSPTKTPVLLEDIPRLIPTAPGHYYACCTPEYIVMAYDHATRHCATLAQAAGPESHVIAAAYMMGQPL